MTPLRAPAVSAAELEALFAEWLSLQCQDGELLGRLLDGSAGLLRAVVHRKLGTTARADEVEDVASEALLDLISHLTAWRDGQGTPIERYPAYVASIGYRAVYDFFRKRHPERHRLKNRVRYALKQGGQFAIWDGEADGSLVSLNLYRHRPVGALPAATPGSAKSTDSLAALAAAFLTAAEAPVVFDSLIDRLALLLGIRDQQVELEDLPAPDNATSFDFPASWTEHLEQLWRIVSELPVPQRIALLLNLRGEQGESPLTLFPATGTASIEDIALVLEIPVLEFLELWNRLPVTDQEIALRLALTRQQVINLRVAARKRLARNLPEVIRQLHEHL